MTDVLLQATPERWKIINERHSLQELETYLKDSLGIDTVDKDDLIYCINALRSSDRDLLKVTYLLNMTTYEVRYQYGFYNFNDVEKRLRTAKKRLCSMYQAVVIDE